MADNLEWLRDRLQGDGHRAILHTGTGAGSASFAPQSDGATALDLVHQAARMIHAVTERAGEAEARARLIVESAINKLEAAESRHRVEQSRQGEKLDQAAAELAEAGKTLKRLQIRIATAEAELSAAETRAEAAEARAAEAREALLRVEDAIRVHLLLERPEGSGDLSAAA
jgi:chromosome segregation ATPase